MRMQMMMRMRMRMKMLIESRKRSLRQDRLERGLCCVFSMVSF